MRRQTHQYTSTLALTLAVATIGGAWSAARAEGSPTPAMTLGRVAPAPPGFLAFCARVPAQCGLTGVKDESGQPLVGDALHRKLLTKYYWSLALSPDREAGPSLVPTSGVATSEGPTPPPTPTAVDTPAIVPSAQSTLGGVLEGKAQPDLALSKDLLVPETSSRFSFGGVVSQLVSIDGDLPGAAQDTVPGWRLPRSQAWSPATYRLNFGQDDGASLSETSQDATAPHWPVWGHLQSPSSDPALSPSGGVALSIVEGAAPTPPTQSTPAVASQIDAPLSVALTMSPELKKQLDRVNLQINRAVRYVSDSQLYGDEDYWHMPLSEAGPAAGDCKDYVLEKRGALIADGIPAEALSIAIVETRWGETHAVLLVNTDQGEVVLDSLSDWIKPWRKAPYRWVERQAPGRQLTWVSLT